jgi:transposase InsO family protein
VGELLGLGVVVSATTVRKVLRTAHVGPAPRRSGPSWREFLQAQAKGIVAVDFYRRYCYPLTITDFASRHLLTCEALATTAEKFALTVFERAFKDFGLPRAIRTDNGAPFASAWALYGLSKLSVWWLRLGIHLDRITPGHPEQNGRHERMHLTLKKC